MSRPGIPGPAPWSNWRAQKSKSGGGLLMDWGCYDLDWLCFILGDQFRPIKAFATLGDMVGDVESLERAVGLLVYGTLAAVAIFGQGGTAWFYHTRRPILEGYLRDTPPWILGAQRAGMPM